MQTFKLSTLILSCIILLFTACQKDGEPLVVTKEIHDTIYIIKHDTIIAAQLTRLQLLTQKCWRVDEVQRNINGINSAFITGGINSTGVTYQNIKISFKVDGSGTYTDENSMKSSLTWVFTTTDQRNLLLTIGGPNNAVFEWRMLELKDNYLHCSTPYNSNSLYATRYIQIP